MGSLPGCRGGGGAELSEKADGEGGSEGFGVWRAEADEAKERIELLASCFLAIQVAISAPSCCCREVVKEQEGAHPPSSAVDITAAQHGGSRSKSSTAVPRKGSWLIITCAENCIRWRLLVRLPLEGKLPCQH